MNDAKEPGSESWVVQAWNGAQTVTADQANGPAEDDLHRRALEATFAIKTIEQMQVCRDSREAARVLANRLQQFLGCRQVAVGLSGSRTGKIHVAGMSGVVRHDSHSSYVNALLDAMEETRRSEGPVAWPDDESQNNPSKAHEQLTALLGADSVVSVQLRDSDGLLVGVCVFVDEEPVHVVPFVARYRSALASCLNVVRQHESGIFGRLLRTKGRNSAKWGGRRRAIGVAAVAAVLLFVVPIPYRVRCKCRVQPLTRRYVAAPHDGTLQKALRAPGDVVRKDELLARLDQREIAWELASLETDRAHAEKERDAAMALHQTSAAQLAALKIERLELQVQLLEHRQANLEIRSPIDGMVVAGDLEKAEGAPLTVGQTMFEIAPLKKMLVEVDIAEGDVGYVDDQAAVRVVLNAGENATLTGRLCRVHPQAELRDEESVFVGEMEIDNDLGRLRPGMSGYARVGCGSRSLAWITFHKPWARLRQMLAW